MKKLSIIFSLTIGSFILFAAFYSPIATKFELTESGKKTKFKAFLSNFEEIQLPYKFDQADFMTAIEERKENYSAIYNSEKRITKEFKTFVPGVEARFSRSGPSVYLYESILASTNTNATVLYSIYHPYHEYPQYMLVTYDATGKMLEETVFADRNFDKISIGSIDKKKNVVIKTYEINIEDEIRFDERIPEESLKLQSVTTLKVSKKGTLEETATASL
jgi:hypothetical protein